MLFKTIKKYPVIFMALILGIILGIPFQIYFYENYTNENE